MAIEITTTTLHNITSISVYDNHVMVHFQTDKHQSLHVYVSPGISITIIWNDNDICFDAVLEM